jgi:transcriptional regulator with XRE-family HTH domain
VDRTVQKYVRMSSRVREWRTENGLSQREVANELGVAGAFICQLEYTDRNPTYQVALDYIELSNGELTLEDFGYALLPDGRPVRILDLT